MRTLGAFFALIAFAAAGLAVAGVRPAHGQDEKITICHAAGLAGTTHFVTLELPREAVFGEAGHFFENGTPRAGHEQDYMGPCRDETTTTTTTTPRGVATAGAICILALEEYRVVGTIDGQAASVSPETIPGSKSGPTLVTVTLGADSQQVIVNTDGLCVQDSDDDDRDDRDDGDDDDDRSERLDDNLDDDRGVDDGY